MKNIIKILCAIFIFSGISISGFSQNFYKERIPKTDILSIGMGPSFIYADNGGQYKLLRFKWNPAFTLSYTKKLNDRFGIKSTGGLQFIESGGKPTNLAQQIWQSNNGAFTFQGQAYFIDVMPIVYMIPFYSHVYRSYVNLYGGLGIGLLHVNRTQTSTLNKTDGGTVANTTTQYIPFRAGISFKLGELSDLALEGTVLYTFSDDLDGNQNFNAYNDHLAQAQIVYKRFLNPKTRK